MSEASEVLAPFFLSDDPQAVLDAARELSRLSVGEIRKPEGLNPRTHKPERGGLHCAALFGPVEDHRCNCGFLASAAGAGQRCEKCGVECIESRVRRERWAHITAPVPLIHPALAPSIAGQLGCTEEAMRLVARFMANLNVDGSVVKARRSEGWWQFADKAEEERRARGARYLEAQLGGSRDLMLVAVPVTPAGWRGGRRDAQDVVYVRLVNRCNRLARLIELGAPQIILDNEERETQRAFERLCAAVRAEVHARQRRPPSAPAGRNAELLQAVLADPEDDGVRAVYADWLMEQGDPRGEFIALQLANAHRSRMSKQESELLSRHMDEWLAPLGSTVDYVVFRRGFLSSCKALREAAPHAGHPIWATVEHLDTELVALLADPAMRALKKVSTTWRALGALCKAGPQHRVQAANVRMHSCPPSGWEPVVQTAALPRLRELVLLHQTASGPEDWGWFLSAPLCQQLSSLTLAMAIDRLGALSIADWLEVLDSHPDLTHLVLSYAKKKLVWDLLRTADGGTRIALRTAPSLVEWVLMVEQQTITHDIGRALAGVDRRRVRLEAARNRWLGAPFEQVVRQLRDQLGDAAALPEVTPIVTGQ